MILKKAAMREAITVYVICVPMLIFNPEKTGILPIMADMMLPE